jgi:site-specific recombinase XerD
MGRHAKDSTIKVHDGVYLNAANGVYQCYFRLGARQFRRSTKTKNLAEAKLTALQWHKEAQAKQERGEEIDPVSFANLKRSYLDQIKHATKYPYHQETIERHFLPFFAKFDDVSKIRTTDIFDYLNYRRGKGEQAPKPQTLNRENSVLRQLMRHAVERGWMTTAPQIKTESEKLTTRRRRHFTIEEYRKLHRTSRKRAREFEGVPLKTRQHWQRQLLHDYILFLANTGMRVDESKTVIWRKVDFNDGSIRLEYAGKTRSSRKVLMRPTAAIALQRIKQRRLEYLAATDGKLDPNEKVIALIDGTVIGSFKKGFGELLEACGFEYPTVQDRHTLTSLRHTYATFRLTTRSGERATMRDLAKQMGTSERMIERHYGHDQIEDYREELG